MVAQNTPKPLLLKRKTNYLVEIRRETPPGGRGMEAATIITEYQNHLKALGYADATVENYRRHLNIFKDYLSTEKITDLRKVTRDSIKHFQEEIMAEKHTAMETKALKLRPVKRLFEYLTENNQLLINPTEGFKETCRQNRKMLPVLTIAEMQRLLQQPNLSFRMEIRNRAFMEILYSAGIRSDELLNLTVHDVDFKSKVLYVRKAKGRKQRVVPLGKTARRYLREYLEKIRPRYSKKNPKERILFLKNTGHPMQPHNLRNAIREYRDKAKIKKPVSPHTFRRTCATHLVQQGADIRYIQKLLGHSRLDTTQYYTKIMPVEVKDTHKKSHPGIREKKC